MKALQLILVLTLLACPAAMAEVTVVVDDVAPLSCYGFVGSVPAGTTTTVSFCATTHGCEMETQRAGNAICASTFAAECAKRDCPEGQECIPIEMAGSEDISLTNCRRLPAPAGTCSTDEVCACDANLTKRLDCGCMCREKSADAEPTGD